MNKDEIKEDSQPLPLGAVIGSDSSTTKYDDWMKITTTLPVALIIPILKTFKVYFDTKYPCDKEETCGDNMPLDDETKQVAYDFILSVYNKHSHVAETSYKAFHEKLSTFIK